MDKLIIRIMRWARGRIDKDNAPDKISEDEFMAIMESEFMHKAGLSKDERIALWNRYYNGQVN